MNRDAWLAERRAGLGGSDLGAILGLSQFRTPVQVWLEKTGREAGDDPGAQRNVRFGNYAEQFVADEYTRETGLRVQRYRTMLHHADAPILGNVDRLVIPPGAKMAAHRREIRTDRGLECKTASAFAVLDQGTWGESGTDQVPPAYLIQAATYMLLTGCAQWDLAVLFGNGARDSDFRIYRLKRDPELEQMLVARATEWWTRHVVADVAPESTRQSDLDLLFPQSVECRVDADAALALAAQELADTRAERRAIEAAESALELRLKAAMADADTLAAGDRVLATWKSAKERRTTDWQTVARAIAAQAFDSTAQLDALVALHTSTTPGSRRFLLKLETPE